uniref:Aldehyde oxidase/xanthine dehydrogenase second molybdopterin binding domain-containing protein n=1 Tax=Timema cristinae TaxID=61476 RepID=A0A7R9CXB6_TIMCR|nr:unnamed protein product [Timema cristinae]
MPDHNARHIAALWRRPDRIISDLPVPEGDKDSIVLVYMKRTWAQISSRFSSQREGKPYAVYGVCVSEVEIDVLTGQQQGEPVARYRMVPLFQVKRVDILEDAGQSISPLIDVGQVTGAFVMGIGVWTHEDIVYDPTTGAVLTNRTWNYYPPGMKDIPVDFRVTLKKDSPNPVGVARSKDGPLTTEAIFLNCSTTPNQFSF